MIVTKQMIADEMHLELIGTMRKKIVEKKRRQPPELRDTETTSQEGVDFLGWLSREEQRWISQPGRLSNDPGGFGEALNGTSRPWSCPWAPYTCKLRLSGACTMLQEAPVRL